MAETAGAGGSEKAAKGEPAASDGLVGRRPVPRIDFTDRAPGAVGFKNSETMRDPRGLLWFARPHGGRAVRSRRARLRHLLAAPARADRIPHRSGRGLRRPRSWWRSSCTSKPKTPRKSPSTSTRPAAWSPRVVDLRHHAVHPLPGVDPVRQSGGLHGFAPAVRGRAGLPFRGSQRPDHGPPALRRLPGAGDGHHDPCPGERSAQAPPEPGSTSSTPARITTPWSRRWARQLHDRRRRRGLASSTTFSRSGPSRQGAPDLRPGARRIASARQVVPTG